MKKKTTKKIITPGGAEAKKPEIPCDCITKNKEALVKKIIQIQSQKKSGFKVLESNWERMSFYPRVQLYTHLICQTQFVLKSGGPSRPQNTPINVMFNYCPFCGKAYPKQERKDV